MPPKKKNAPNAFMLFTYEWKAKYGQRMSLSEATTAAGKLWAEMGPQERGPYNAKAKEEKLGSKHKAEKLTCTGQPVSLVEKEKAEAEQNERQVKRNIETIVRQSLKSGELETQSYFFIMVNYFTKTLKGGVFVPAEVSVCQYSLKEGVYRVYHTFVNPAVTIYGHQYEAQHHSDTTHMLPLPPKAMGETCLSRIYNDILEFVRCKETGQYPPIYTSRECVHIVESVLEFLMAEPGASNVKLNVYPIQYLFFVLKEATCEVGELEKPKSFFITDAFFERDHFEYTVGCKYHDDMDRNRYCTKSYVTRWGYIFSDYMCADLAISLIPERHAPEGTNLSAVAAAASTFNDTASMISMMTETSCSTKALSEHKIYRDEQKSGLSNRTSTTWHTTKQQKSSLSGFENDDFPSLGQPNRKKPANSDSKMRPQFKSTNQKIFKNMDSYMDSSEVDDTDYNPWNARSRAVPPKPTDTSVFNVDVKLEDEGRSPTDFSDIDDFNMMSGIGRGRDINRSMNSTLGSSYGRGRVFRP